MDLNALLHYSVIAGESSTGGIDEFGAHRFLQQFSDTPGWTHIVATKAHLLYYNQETTAIATAHIDARGNHQVLQRYSANAVWTSIATTEDHVLFYNGNTGDAEVGEIDDLGNYRSLHIYTDFTLGWTHIAAIQDRVLYYSAATTELATAQIDADGHHQFIHRYLPGSTLTWTHLASTQKHFLFYDMNEGGGLVSIVDELGNYLPLQSYPDLSKNWTHIAGTQRHVLYYSANLGGVAATGDIDEQGSLRDLNFYDNFPQGLTHIVAPKIATLPNPTDSLVDPSIELIRPDDLLNLRIECRNLQLDKGDRPNPILVATDTTQAAYLIVQFPPQTIVEEAIFEPEPPPVQPPPNEISKPYNTSPPGFPGSQMPTRARARIGQPSRLVFQLPANSNPRIPYTTAGLLNWAGLELNVSPIAAISEPSTPDQRANAPAIAPPTELETAIEIPYRLILSPNREVVWDHATQPKTHAGRTELWHTRLAKRVGEKITPLSKANPAPLRAIWSPDYVAPGLSRQPWPKLGEADEWAGSPVLTAMNRRDRHELVVLTSAFSGFVEDKSPIYPDYLPLPIQAEQVMLSPLGGWLKSRGNWEPPVEWLPRLFIANPINLQVENINAQAVEPELRGLIRWLDPGLGNQIIPELLQPPNFLRRLGRKGKNALNISEWVHVATQGRDHYVRIVYEGFLYPFGHRAALIKVTERKIRSVNRTPFAYLAQRMFIVVREPLKDYSREPLEHKGLGMPLKQVRLTTLVTPDIDLPQKLPSNDPKVSPIIDGTDYCFWVRVNQADFRFHAVGQDSERHAVDFTTALIFVPKSETGKIAQVKTEYNRDAQRKIGAVPGQAITYAARDGSPSDNTTLTTQSLYFDTHPAGVTLGGFLPRLEKAAVNLTAVEQILGTTTPVEIQYFDAYLNNEKFDSANEVFAVLVNKVQSNFTADKAGGIATPNLSITSITRKLGAIAGTPAKAASPDPFNPKDFFGDVADKALLFGKLKLSELLDDSGTFANAPKIQPFPQASPPAVELTWEPQVKQQYGPDFLKFESTDPDRRLRIRARIEKPTETGTGRSEFSGQLNQFKLTFLNVLALNFVAFTFKSETDRKPDVKVELEKGNPLQFQGDLEFVEDLKDIIPPELFGKGPSLEITAERIRVGFAIGLPPVAVGVFALKDVSLSAALELPFADGNPVFDFGISERQHPFNLTIAFFGGGGFFHLQLDTQQGLRVVEAAFEFGASVSINLGVASGGVYIMAGIYFKLEIKEGKDYATLSGYFRMGGELSILGLISVSLEFLLSFTYESKTGKASGRATLTVKVEILFFSKSIAITVEKKFGGKNADPIFSDTWETPALWDEYAGAFA